MPWTRRVGPVLTPAAANPGENKPWMPVLEPPGPQHRKGLLCGRDKAVLAAFSTPDENPVLLGLHVTNLEAHRFRDPQSTDIDQGQRDPQPLPLRQAQGLERSRNGSRTKAIRRLTSSRVKTAGRVWADGERTRSKSFHSRSHTNW
jgi:hypothetical protein